MKYYKLKNQCPIFKFSLENIDEILKYRFSAKKCSSSLIGKYEFFCKDAVREITYKITDKKLIESIRLPEESKDMKEFLKSQLENGYEITSVDLGELYIINWEIDANNRIVHGNLTGQKLSYLLEEMIIFEGNDLKNNQEYSKYKEEYGQEFTKLIEHYNERYISLLRKHGYID